MSTIALVTSDTLGTMSTQSSIHYGTTPSTEKKADSSVTVSTMQSAPAQTVVVDAQLFAQMQRMLANQMAQSQVQPITTTLSDGSKYVGQVNQDGKPHGRGFLTYPEGNLRLNYEGEFENGSPHGQGILKMLNGDKYEGHLKAGMTTTGKMTEPNGNYYRGEWQDGKFWNGTYNCFTGGQAIEYKNGEHSSCCVIL